MRARLAAVARRGPLPPGSAAVAVGLAVVGITSYAFLILSARALGPEEYGALSVVWAAVFLIGPGFFLPWEQELGRTLTARRLAGEGTGPVVRRSLLAGAAVAGALLVVGLVAGPWAAPALFRGDGVLYGAVLLAIPAYLVAECAKGILAGQARFGRYALYLGADASLRLAMCVALAAVGVATAGPYGLTLGLAPIVALAPALWRAGPLAAPGPPAPWRPLVVALAGLATAAIASLLLVNLPPLLIEAVAGDDEKDAVGRFTAALVLTRIPVFLFQAIQAALLPHLTELATEGAFDAFGAMLRRLVAGIGALVGLAVVGSLVLGPLAMRLLFGEDYEVTGTTLAALALGSGLFIVASALGQAVIALGGATRVGTAWAAGVAVMVGLVVVLRVDAVPRVQWAYVAGMGVATLAMAGVLRSAVRHGATPQLGEVLDAIAERPLEP